MATVGSVPQLALARATLSTTLGDLGLALATAGRSLELSLGYLAGDAGNPGDDSGCSLAPTVPLAQLVFKPKGDQIGFTYIINLHRETLTVVLFLTPRSFVTSQINQ